MSRDFNDAKKQQLKNCTELSDVKKLIGDEAFAHTVSQFDEMNRQVIELYEHKARSLEEFLLPSELGLINDLIGLPSVLYFRRAK